jgi:hypothetical protein
VGRDLQLLAVDFFLDPSVLLVFRPALLRVLNVDQNFIVQQNRQFVLVNRDPFHQLFAFDADLLIRGHVLDYYIGERVTVSVFVLVEPVNRNRTDLEN